MKRIVSAALAAATVLAVSSVASSSPGSLPSRDEAALAPTRAAPDRGIEAKVDALLDEDDHPGEAAAGAAALRRPGHRRRRQGRRRRRLQPGRPGEDRPPPARRGRAVAAAHPDPVRLRHHPRLPDDLPGPAGRRQLVRPGGRPGRRHDRRPRVRDGRPQADLQPDGRRLPRAALGPDRRGQRRGPLRRLRDGRGPGQGCPGHGLLGDGQGRHQRQALRRLRRSPRAAATTTPPTCPSSGCATSTCRRSRPRSTPAPTR